MRYKNFLVKLATASLSKILLPAGTGLAWQFILFPKARYTEHEWIQRPLSALKRMIDTLSARYFYNTNSSWIRVLHPYIHLEQRKIFSRNAALNWQDTSFVFSFGRDTELPFDHAVSLIKDQFTEWNSGFIRADSRQRSHPDRKSQSVELAFQPRQTARWRLKRHP